MKEITVDLSKMTFATATPLGYRPYIYAEHVPANMPNTLFVPVLKHLFSTSWEMALIVESIRPNDAIYTEPTKQIRVRLRGIKACQDRARAAWNSIY